MKLPTLHYSNPDHTKDHKDAGTTSSHIKTKWPSSVTHSIDFEHGRETKQQYKVWEPNGETYSHGDVEVSFQSVAR